VDSGEKMRLSLKKTSEQTYGIVTGRMAHRDIVDVRP
jgi:hypothetical protein